MSATAKQSKVKNMFPPNRRCMFKEPTELQHARGGRSRIFNPGDKVRLYGCANHTKWLIDTADEEHFYVNVEWKDDGTLKELESKDKFWDEETAAEAEEVQTTAPPAPAAVPAAAPAVVSAANASAGSDNTSEEQKRSWSSAVAKEPVAASN
ncbi:unnamed protein product [Vitrella brassicaformis CCMP3155]|uniref:Uncharacterized protein n=1 Tax=Vitrella brassicaformis (strain CCMP3155) TaxID=1169540 RepID=A0A0G4GWA7_VITBC|nr:unnamed protein product [Vitrella brassicaformis CCMP3155]|eukprot:CEM35292.1 unnamed protein product [Vitrella brassicaformis CCMP3155]